VRPFGVSLLLAGRDENGPQLYQIDPSGSYFAWKASAIGKNYTNAKTFLEKRWVWQNCLCCSLYHIRAQPASPRANTVIQKQSFYSGL
jgi:20S proteasome alpha/beta subunit